MVSIVEINSSKNGEKIYIKKKNWGLLGDAQVIVISESPEEDFEPDENSEYIFKGLSPFFYNLENDTLNVYLLKKSKVPNINSEITIHQVELTNPEMMDLMSIYEEKGLKKVK